MVRLLLLAFCASTALAQTCPFDTIYFNGNILTGNGLTTDTPERISVIAVSHGVIQFTGTDLQMIAGCETAAKVDLQGAFVMPGFNDAHTHIASAGQQKLSVDLDGVQSLAEMLDRIKAYADKAKPGQWLLGSGWDHTKWPGKKLPTRLDLDTVTGKHPAVFYRTDGHIVVANTAALTAAHISTLTKDPEGGKIDRDATGIPTGIVREAPAVALVYKVVPPIDPETRRKALRVAMDDALAHGVTSVQDFSDWDDWLAMEAMEKDGRLPLRVSEWMDFNLPLATLKQRRASHDSNDLMLHLAQLKGFMDGSLGSRTAALAKPYSDDPNNYGIPRYEQEKLNDLATARAAAGFQLGFHAIGDQANTIALNALSAAEQVAAIPNPLPCNSEVMIGTEQCKPGAPRLDSETWDPRSPRFRIEHAQVLLPADFDRFARLGIIASMQPSHLLDDMLWAGDRLGPERAKYAYAWRSMLDHHITLAFGTDYPVESISPFRGLYAAVTRKTEPGTQTFHPEQRISIGEAIYAYTQASAYAEFRETHKGKLEKGFVADFVVLDRDLMKATPEEILGTKVLQTVVANKTMYLAP